MDAHHDNTTAALSAPDDHLPFALREVRHSSDPAAARQTIDVNYFSLTAAICALLDRDKLLRCDPQVAAAAGQLPLEGLSVVNRYTEFSYASYVYARPGAEPDRPYDGPGIYLRVPLGSVWMQEMTGLPFPQNDDLEDASMILLAQYNRSYDQLLDTPLLAQLREAAAKYEQMHGRAFDSHGYSLAIHGHFTEPQDVLKGKEVTRFCDFHHFTNGFEAMRQLLLINIHSYNHQCAGGNLLYEYNQVHILNPAGMPEVIVHNRSLENHLSGDRKPGIWLEATGDIGGLYDFCAIDFTRWFGVDASNNELRLAAYKYDGALSLQYSASASNLISELRVQHDDFLDYPISTLSLQVSYNIAPVEREEAPYMNIRHYYHHDDCRAALQQMMALDMPLLLDGGERVPVGLSWAALNTRNGLQLAQLAASTNDSQPDRVILTVFTPMAAQDPGLYQTLCEILQLDAASQQPVLALTVADYDLANQRWRPVPSAVALLAALEVFRGHGIDAPEQAPDAINAIHIQLEWNRPARSGETLTEVISLSQDMHSVHRFLLQMDEKLFVPDAADPLRPWIVSASLCESASDEIIVKRFYQLPSAPQLEGDTIRLFDYSLLQYHPQRPDARELADSLGAGVAEAMRPPGQTQPPARSCHPRELPDDPGPTGGQRPRH